jgi:hypothetical protein
MPEPTAFRVRRATVEDLNALIEMWSAMRFDVVLLEKRLTEFQVAESADAKVVGTVGFQVIGQDGLVHHEAFADFSLADTIRFAIWDRLLKIAENHGLYRIWTQEDAPFWGHNGLLPASAELLAKLPSGLDPAAKWLVVTLREETPPPRLTAEEDFEKFIETEREKTGQIVEKARTMKSVATLIAVVLFLGVMAAAIYLLMRMRQPIP